MIRWTHGFCLLFVVLMSAPVFAQGVGSRGAVEVQTLDDAPPPPAETTTEETATATETATEAAPEAPTEAVPEAATEAAPEAATEAETTPEEAAAEPEASDAVVEAEPSSAAQPAPPEAETRGTPEPTPSTEPDPTERSVQRVEVQVVPTESASESAPRALTADPILSEVEAFVSLFGQDRTLGGLLGLLAWFALAVVFSLGVRMLRERLPSEGLIPNVLALVHLGVRLIVIALALAFIVRALPPRLSLVMLLAFGGLAVAIGWSMRDVLPDLVASLVIAFERRVRRGVWVSGEGFAGQVERLGLRAAILNDSQGRPVTVPNRHLVQAPVTAGGSHEREHEVELRLDVDASAELVRQALRDAVLSSPWVFPGAAPIVLRDPSDPTRWRVRGRLLEASFGARFEGELLERAEAMLSSYDGLAS